MAAADLDSCTGVKEHILSQVVLKSEVSLNFSMTVHFYQLCSLLFIIYYHYFHKFEVLYYISYFYHGHYNATFSHTSSGGTMKVLNK